jgi:GST-like protein
MYEVHYWPTPNGKKVTVLLEELGVPYRVTPCNIGRGDQFTDGFLKMNPNHRMPVLIDHDPADRGAPISIFESGAIMTYIAE